MPLVVPSTPASRPPVLSAPPTGVSTPPGAPSGMRHVALAALSPPLYTCIARRVSTVYVTVTVPRHVVVVDAGCDGGGVIFSLSFCSQFTHKHKDRNTNHIYRKTKRRKRRRKRKKNRGKTHLLKQHHQDYLTLPYLPSPYPLSSTLTLPYHTIPYLTIPFLSSLYPTLSSPYLTPPFIPLVSVST